MSVAADDDMIANLDLEQLAGANEVAGNLDVGLGRRGVAAGMVVEHDNGGGIGQYRETKHGQGCHEERVERADGY